jgi:hypothetical protein
VFQSIYSRECRTIKDSRLFSDVKDNDSFQRYL